MSGGGRYNDVKRELSGISHAATARPARFKTGRSRDVGTEGIAVYNTTILTAMGPGRKAG